MSDQTTKDLRELSLRQTEWLGMPCPRLQLTWLPMDNEWLGKECVYTLVLPLKKLDIRAEDSNGKPVRRELHVEIGLTTVTGGKKPIESGLVSTPYRDGAHSLWDAKILQLPRYAVCDGVATRLEEEQFKL